MSGNLDSIVGALAEQRAALLDELLAAPSGGAWCERHTHIADQAVRAVYKDVGDEFPELPEVAIIATGGYGRRELCPCSDIDITVVPEDESSKSLDPFIRKLYQGLHLVFETGLKLRVGYAYRLLSDAPGLDAVIRTGLLDARRIDGSRAVAKRLDERLAETMPAGEFLIAKIQEREIQFKRFNGTPLVVEPNLKEGAGGLRCFHCANWMREAIGERPIKLSPAFDQVLMMRNLLHASAGHLQDTLLRPRQAAIADLLGQDVYEMMSQLAGAGLELHREYLQTKEKLSESRFNLSPGVAAVRGEARIASAVDAGEAAIGIAIATELNLRIEEASAVPIQGISGPAVLFAISKGERTLRNLDRCGLLQAILPELTACRTLMPRDAVHAYTVFEHTLRAVDNIFDIGSSEPLALLRDSLNNLSALVLACLLHDVGKIQDEETHSAIGERMAQTVCERWDLPEETVKLVSWLVREHLLMARTIRLRDVMNPLTVKEFVQAVGDRERLDLLTLLTYADIAAVSSSAWTPALETFLLTLHARAAHMMTEDQVDAPNPGAYRRRLLLELRGGDVDEEKIQEFVESLPANYLASNDPATVRLQFRFAQRAREGVSSVDIVDRHELSATDVTICALDRPGLLSQVLGVFYALDLSLVALRASTTATEPMVALDVFTVSFGDRPVPTATAQHLAAELEAVLAGRSVDELMLQRGKDGERKPRISQYAYLGGNPGILEIRAPSGRGMAYRFSRLLAEKGWNVHAARVGQWAGSGAAAFYISGPRNKELTKDQIDAAMGTLS